MSSMIFGGEHQEAWSLCSVVPARTLAENTDLGYPQHGTSHAAPN